jgi:hypothetical protein
MALRSPDLSKTDPEAYKSKMDRMIGARDPIEILGETADILGRIVGTQPVEEMRRRPYEGKWTPNEILGHLVDAEWVYGFRMRLVLCEDSPTILGMDQERWVDGQQYNDREPSDLLLMFRSMRACNLPLWKQMSAADLERTGKHNERGPESLGVMLRMLAGHDLSHIDQIQRYLAAE